MLRWAKNEQEKTGPEPIMLYQTVQDLLMEHWNKKPQSNGYAHTQM